MELPVCESLNEPTASPRRLVPRSGMVEECDRCVHPKLGLLLPASAVSTPLWTAVGRGVGAHHCLSQRDKIARRERERERREGERVVRMEGREKERERVRDREKQNKI